MSERDRTFWDRHAAGYDRSMWLLGGPMPRVVELVAEAVTGAERVLEVAAGTGLVTMAIARKARSVVATDYSERMVAVLGRRVAAAQLTNVECRQADLYHPGFDAGSFDAVVAANVLHLVPDLPGALASLRRLLRHDGRLIVPTYCHDETRLARLASRVLSVSGFPGRRRFSAASLRRELEAAGLRVQRAETISGLLPIAYIDGAFGVPS